MVFEGIGEILWSLRGLGGFCSLSGDWEGFVAIDGIGWGGIVVLEGIGRILWSLRGLGVFCGL